MWTSCPDASPSACLSTGQRCADRPGLRRPATGLCTTSVAGVKMVFLSGGGNRISGAEAVGKRQGKKGVLGEGSGTLSWLATRSGCGQVAVRRQIGKQG